MTLDLRLALEVVGIIVALLTQWFLLRGQVNELTRLVAEAQRRADAAHTRLDKHQDEVFSVRLELRGVSTKLEGLEGINGRLDRLMLAVNPKGENA